jgi:hypothetical protein
MQKANPLSQDTVPIPVSPTLRRLRQIHYKFKKKKRKKERKYA